MAEILLYGIIGDPSDKLDARTVTDLIRAASGNLDIRINSPGGYVFEGLPVFEALAAYDRGRVTVHIDGLAASMASVIAMAGSEIIMAETALMMIHRPWDAAIGHADDLRKDAARLDKIEQQLVGVYARRTGLSADRISTMLAAETWFTAVEAIELGFATSITAPLKLAAMVDISACGFRHPPEILKGTSMTTEAQAVAAERERISTIMTMGEKHRLPADFTNALVSNGVSLEQARAHVLDVLAERGDSLEIGHTVSVENRGQQTFDNPTFHAKAISDAIYSRMTGKPPEGAAAEMRHLSLVDMAREMLERRGVRNARRMSHESVLDQFAGRGGIRPRVSFLAGSGGAAGAITHTTSDFPDLLTATGERYLLDQFVIAETMLKKLGRKTTARDFRTKYGISMGDFPALNQVNEGGEIHQMTLSARKEGYKVDTFAGIFTLSRQAIVNDDLGALSDPLRLMARSAAETEATLLAALLNSNPVMSDGNALFSTAHNNLIPSGTGPTVAAVDAMRMLLASQKSLSGNQPLEIRPALWLGPIGLGGAMRIVNGSQYDPDTANKLQRMNIALGIVQSIIDTPRLTNTTAWYFFADPELSPVLEYAYLNGQEAPQLDSREGWNVLGMEYRVVMDFGAGFVDWRGAVKNAGT